MLNELAERQIEHTDGQIELADEHAERQIEHANGQIELADEYVKRRIEQTLNEQHADGPIEQNDKHSSSYINWQVEWQEQAEKQIELSDGHSKSINWPNNLVEIIKGVHERTLQNSAPPRVYLRAIRVGCIA
jgi:hypothetical protein